MPVHGLEHASSLLCHASTSSPHRSDCPPRDRSAFYPGANPIVFAVASWHQGARGVRCNHNPYCRLGYTRVARFHPGDIDTHDDDLRA